MSSLIMNWSNVVSRVPKGSVLGPVLFLLYVKLSMKSHLLLFADDIKLYRSIQSDSDITQLQEEINHLLSWSNTWLLNFSIYT